MVLLGQSTEDCASRRCIVTAHPARVRLFLLTLCFRLRIQRGTPIGSGCGASRSAVYSSDAVAQLRRGKGMLTIQLWHNHGYGS